MLLARSRYLQQLTSTLLGVSLAVLPFGMSSAQTAAISPLPASTATELTTSTGETVQVAWAFTPERFLTLTNTIRANAGVAALQVDSLLTAAAQAKALDMAAQGYWEHFRPSDGKAPWAFIAEQGYAYRVAGENLARGFSTPEGITKAWMASPAHRANLTSAKYQEVGYASLQVTHADGSQTLLTVQLFGSR